jgi:hypothetical protein
MKSWSILLAAWALVATVWSAAAPAATVAADEAAYRVELEKLRSRDGAVREKAAAEVRRILEKYPDGLPAVPRTTNGLVENVPVMAPENFTGRWVTYFANGRVAKEATYRAGKLVGRLMIYHDNGQPQSEVNYDDEGVSDGTDRNWRRDGTLFYEVTHVKGLLHGREVFWGDTGEIETERFHDMGQRLDP